MGEDRVVVLFVCGCWVKYCGVDEEGALGEVGDSIDVRLAADRAEVVWLPSPCPFAALFAPTLLLDINGGGPMENPDNLADGNPKLCVCRRNSAKSGF